MNKFIRYTAGCCLAVLLAACSGASAGGSGTAELAPAENLRIKMESLRQTGTLLGHQDDLAFGSIWFGENARSDVRDVCGDYPAVFGWDISGIEKDVRHNPDSVSFEKMREYILSADRLGGISSIRWDVSGTWQKNGTVREAGLDSVAAFLQGLSGKDGCPFALVFQPQCGSDIKAGNWTMEGEAYRKAWCRTVHYLRDEKKIDNVLFAFSFYNPESPESLKEYYPGDGYVDIIGAELLLDSVSGIGTYKADLKKSVALVSAFAAQHKKIPAVTATGMEGVKVPNFFTACIAPAIAGSHLGYVMFWKNSWKDEKYYHVPVVGHPAAADFKAFAASDSILMCSDVANRKDEN